MRVKYFEKLLLKCFRELDEKFYKLNIEREMSEITMLLDKLSPLNLSIFNNSDNNGSNFID